MYAHALRNQGGAPLDPGPDLFRMLLLCGLDTSLASQASPVKRVREPAPAPPE